MSFLLVSVSSVVEAEAAVRGGADLIDIKDPTRGSLGRADDSVLLDVAKAVAGRRPISASLGELLDDEPLPPQTFLDRARFVKCGLAGCADMDWATKSEHLRLAITDVAPRCTLALAAYADWERAAAPHPVAVCELVIRHGFGGLLVDTFKKGDNGLLDWLSPSMLGDLCRRCRHAGVSIALAGSLDRAHILRLRHLAPDWFAIRGAACRLGSRVEGIDEQRVRSLKSALQYEARSAIERSDGGC